MSISKTNTKITIPLNVNITLDAEDILSILNSIKVQNETFTKLAEKDEYLASILKAVFGAKS